MSHTAWFRRVTPLTTGLALWVCALPALGDEPAASSLHAISYTEFQLRSDAPAKGRTLHSGQGPRAIDVDSSLKIDIDRQRLVEALLPRSQEQSARVASLRERIQALTPVTQDVTTLAEKGQRAARSFLSKGASVAQYEKDVSIAEGAALKTFESLGEAIERRRMDEDPSLTPEQAQAEATKIKESLLTEGYDYEGLARQLDVELRALNSSMEALLDANAGRLGVEVRAHLVKKDGSLLALRLPNYNDETLGPSTRFRRIETALSQQENEAYKEYEELAKEIKQAKNAGEGLRQAFEASMPKLSAELQQLLNGLLAELKRVRKELDDLATALQSTPNAADLAKLPAEVREPLIKLRTDLLDLKKELVAFEQLSGQLAVRLPNMTPMQAYTAVVNLIEAGQGVLSPRKWVARQELVNHLFQAVETHKDKLDPALRAISPLKELLAAKDSLQGFVKQVKEAAVRVQEIFKSVGIAPVVTQWPEPVNQQRRSGTSELDTSLDLTTIKGGREEDEVVIVSYRIYVDEKLVAEREDRFVIRAFGWRGEAFAGLAFHANHRGDGLSTWKPSASIGWYVTRRAWPSNEANTGASNIDYLGVGVSVLSLDFDDEREIELGIAGGVSLFNNFAQVGYGANLSVDEDRGFFFFSIRPLQLGELLGATGF